MIFSKKILTVILIVIIIALIAYFGFIKNREATADAVSEQSEAEQKPEDAPLPVSVAEVVRDDLIIKLKSPGEAVTNMQIAMKAEVSGRIKKIYVKESQHVKKGDLLLELDDRNYALDLESYEADRLQTLSDMLVEQRFEAVDDSQGTVDRQVIASSQTQFKEADELYKKGLISRDKYEAARKALEQVLIESGEMKDEIRAAAKGLTQAEIRVKKAQLDLEKTKIRAPFSGIITNIQISPQENLGAGADLFTLVNISRIQVNATILESEIGKMKLGREVDLKFSAFPDRVLKGRVTAISPIVNPEDKTCRVVITMNNPDELIRPGMHAEVEIAAEIYQNRLMVPQDAVVIRNNRKLVFVFEKGLAKWNYIDVGLENEHFAEVLQDQDQEGGLKPGMQVLVDGHFTMAHDARVRIVK